MFQNIDKIQSELNLVSKVELDNIFLKFNKKTVVDFEKFKVNILTSYKEYYILLNIKLSNCIIDEKFNPTDITLVNYVVEKGTSIHDIYKVRLFNSFQTYHSNFLQRVRNLKGLRQNQIQMLCEVLDNYKDYQT